jgi:hypothetical protein
MRLVIHDDDILHAEQAFAGALKHLAFGLLGDQLLAAPAGEDRFTDLVGVEPAAAP